MHYFFRVTKLSVGATWLSHNAVHVGRPDSDSVAMEGSLGIDRSFAMRVLLER